MNKNRKRTFIYWIAVFLLLVLLLPNILNSKERQAFSDERRIEKARQHFSANEIADSITIVPGEYYRRGKFFTFFAGEKQRELWNTPVKVKVFDYNEAKGGLEPYEEGGSNQTISVRFKDKEDKKWVLRSVNKDQKSALPAYLRPTFLRFLMRDQVAALNPYGHLAVPLLAEAAGIYHNNPELVFVPYNEHYGTYNERMAGRLAYLEEHLNSSWKNRERYGSPKDIVNTEEMLEMQQEEKTPIDTALYLKTRLFDMLISDWDRHPGQWEWALSKAGTGQIFEPIPKDRDNAFYIFDEGILSHITLLLNNKFQSFRNDYGQVSGLLKQSEEQDKNILSSLSESDFKNTALALQKSITSEVVHQAFLQYPENIYQKVGKEHAAILLERLEQLPEVAAKFHALVQEEE